MQDILQTNDVVEVLETEQASAPVELTLEQLLEVGGGTTTGPHDNW